MDIIDNIITSHFALILGKAEDFEITGRLVTKGLLHGCLFGEMFYDPWAQKYVTPTSEYRDDEDVVGYFAFPVSKEYLDYFDYDNEGELAAYDNYLNAVQRGELRVRYIPNTREHVMTVTYSENDGEELVINPLLSRNVANTEQVELLSYQNRNKIAAKRFKPSQTKDRGDKL